MSSLRFVLIMFSQYYKKVINWLNSCLMVGVVWLYAIIVALPPFLGWNSYAYKDNNCAIKDSDDLYYPFFFFLVRNIKITSKKYSEHRLAQ